MGSSRKEVMIYSDWRTKLGFKTQLESKVFRKPDIWSTEEEIWKYFWIGIPKEVGIRSLVSKAKILLFQRSKISFFFSEKYQ